MAYLRGLLGDAVEVRHFKRGQVALGCAKGYGGNLSIADGNSKLKGVIFRTQPSSSLSS